MKAQKAFTFFMIGALWILVFTVIVGIVLYLGELRWRKNNRHTSAEENAVGENESRQEEIAESSPDDEACCGLHLVCEKDSLSPMSAEILYYDDEELDRFIGRDPYGYSPEETDEFREVLMTLRPEDIAGWARSITQRKLELPPEVKDELLMLIREQRDMLTSINKY